MRSLLAIAILVFLFSCHSLTEKERRVKDISGNWIILYPKESVTSSAAHMLYAPIEDSIRMLKGLKLISFSKAGDFRLLDTTVQTGKWVLSDANELYLSGGGKGLDHFRAEFYNYENGILQLKEKLIVEDEPLTVVWHLKKVSDDDPASALFDEEENNWRTPPKEIESDGEIKKRVAAMLRYYVNYYKLVMGLADYFIPQRVILPFRFYQRGMGLPKFDTARLFTGCFYSVRQAKDAHSYLDRAMYMLHNSYPSAPNYLDGYAQFMTMLADEIEEKTEEEKSEKKDGFIR